MPALGGLEKCFGWLLQTSWQAAVMVALILLAQFLLRRRLPPAWRHGLWLLLVARLLLPMTPGSAVSVFNLAKWSPPQATPVTPAPAATETFTPPAPIPVSRPAPATVQPPVTPQFPSAQIPEPPPRLQPSIPPATTAAQAVPKPAARPVNWMRLAAIAWFGGVFILALRFVSLDLRFRRRLARCRPATNESLRQLFDDCAQLLRVKLRVLLIETDEVDSPAVYGLLHMRLLLPVSLRRQLSQDELRHVLLHELAHIKRHDPELNWLLTPLQILHWFNPVLWLAFARMRADRELATDDLALAHTRPQERRAYGETILKVLEGLTQPRVLPGMVGIAESKAQMKERIRAIARGGAPRWRWAACAAAVVIAGITLTNAREEVQHHPVLVAQLSSRAPVGEPATSRGTVLYYDAKPLGRIVGFLRIGGMPATNQFVSIASQPSPTPSQRATDVSQLTQTDGNGKFVFTNVPPGTWTFRHPGPGPVDGDGFVIEPGKPGQVAIGGNGRPVIGKLVIPAEIANPPGGGGDAAKFSYRNVALYGDHRQFVPVIADDGIFRFEDVPAGTWWLMADSFNNVALGADVESERVATAGPPFVIPEMHRGGSDEPLDLGTRTLALVHEPEIGDIVRPFELATTNGGTFKLADHRGQFVLLDFESVRLRVGDPILESVEDRQPHKTEYAALAAAWAAFGQSNLAVLTVQMPPVWSQIRPSTDDNQARPWPVVRLPNGENASWYDQLPFRASFGFKNNTGYELRTNLPAVYLVGPDGKILAKDLHGDNLTAAIATTMAAGSNPENSNRGAGRSPSGGTASDGSSTETPKAPWGEAMNGVSVRLSAAGPVYHPGEEHFFTFAVSNRGPETVSLVENEIAGELECDGVWYSWHSDVVAAPTALAGGEEVDGLPISMSGQWRKDGKFLVAAGDGKHTYRFAVTARRTADNSVIRAVSNPVEVESRPNPPSGNAVSTFVPADLPVIATINGTVVDDASGAKINDYWVQDGFANPQQTNEITWSLSFRGSIVSGPRQGEFSIQGRKPGQAWRILANG